MSPVLKSSKSGPAPKAAKPAAAAGAGKAKAAGRRVISSQKPAAKGKKRVPGAKKIQLELLPGFSRQLAAMLSAGAQTSATTAISSRHDQHPLAPHRPHQL